MSCVSLARWSSVNLNAGLDTWESQIYDFRKESVGRNVLISEARDLPVFPAVQHCSCPLTQMRVLFLQSLIPCLFRHPSGRTRIFKASLSDDTPAVREPAVAKSKSFSNLKRVVAQRFRCVTNPHNSMDRILNSLVAALLSASISISGGLSNVEHAEVVPIKRSSSIQSAK